MISDNIRTVTQRIAKSCEKSGRPSDDVELVCVTKEADAGQIGEAIGIGVHTIGENRVQDALAKHRIIGDKAAWHLIGHLQTNKAKDALRIFSLIHSLYSVRLAGEIDKEAKKIGKVQDVLVQVNVSGEESKFGIASGELEGFFKETSLYKNINIRGLMTIAPLADDPEKSRPHFRRLKELRDTINDKRLTINELCVLSMGMTDDFEIAIEEGSTMVRIGRAIFAAQGGK